jgi:tyrosyl-tRNA synthetase
LALKRDVASGCNPRDVKFKLADELVTRFHGAAAARKAYDSFVQRFQKGALPDEMPEVELVALDGKLRIANLLRDAGLTPSIAEALRMIKQGAVRIDGERIEDRGLEVAAGSIGVYQVGKRRFARVKVN